MASEVYIDPIDSGLIFMKQVQNLGMLEIRTDVHNAYDIKCSIFFSE